MVQFDCYRHQRLGKDFSHPLEMTNKIAKLSSRTKREIFPNCTTTAFYLIVVSGPDYVSALSSPKVVFSRASLAKRAEVRAAHGEPVELLKTIERTQFLLR